MQEVQPSQLNANRPRLGWPRYIGWLLPGSFAVTAVLTLLASSFSYRLPFGGIGFVLSTLLLGNCIGALMFFVLPRVLPMTAHWRPVSRNISAGLLVACLAALAVWLTALVLVLTGQLPWQDWSRFFFQVARSVVPLSVLTSFVIMLVRELRQRLDQTQLRLRERELAEARANALAAEASLSALTAQVNPHFLFNTLNSIAALIQEEPREAEQTLERLATLLRFTLESAQRPLVPLAQELKIVRDYLAIEQLRLGERLRYDIAVAPDLIAASVPPLALQTIVENSVKYSVAARRSGGCLTVKALRVATGLQLKVTDDGAGFTESDLLPGHGLQNLRARLAVLFGDAACLAFAREDSLTTVTLTLPWRVEASEALPDFKQER